MTLLTTPIFDFHKVISSLMTPTPTPTPSLVKTSLESVTDGNRGKADVVATSWQQVFTRSACKKLKKLTKIPLDISRLQVNGQKG